MTDKQIKAARETLSKTSWNSYTPEQEQLRKELSCREMIISILVYRGVEGLFDKDGRIDYYLRSYAEYTSDAWNYIGMERVLELIEEQKADFEKAVVLRNTYTDHEGCTYNSIIWADDERRDDYWADGTRKLKGLYVNGIGAGDDQEEANHAYTLYDGLTHNEITVDQVIDQIKGDTPSGIEPEVIARDCRILGYDSTGLYFLTYDQFTGALDVWEAI